MVDRNRYREVGPFTGTYDYGSTHRTKSSYDYDEQCIDVDGDRETDHPLTLRTQSGYVTKITGSNGTRLYKDWPIDYDRVTYVNNGAPDGTPFSDLVTAALAGMNPATSQVDLPVFIAELGDLPKLVKLQGRNVLERMAGANLNYQFGWKPLISDLQKLYAFQMHVDKLADEINSLYESGGLRRRHTFEDEETESSLSALRTLTSTYGLSLKAKHLDRAVHETWATAKWIPSNSLTSRLFGFKPGTPNRRKLIKYVLGLHISQFTSSLWEGLPWSWMVDWFSDVGSFLQASNNSIAMVSGHINFMRTTTVTREFSEIQKIPSEGWDPLSAELEIKQRVLLNPVPKVVFRSFLSKRKWSILGSLAVLRGRRNLT